MNVLVTGGVGYIGSHTVVRLLESGFNIIIIDNCANSKPEILKRIEIITGKNPTFLKGDIRDRSFIANVFSSFNIDIVIHFAGLKSVGESNTHPLLYYQNNVQGSIVLFDEMRRVGVKKIVFSSSATVYGIPDVVPITENSKLATTNPYGQTKLVVEKILHDVFRSDPSWNISILRYFNPVGAHESGLIGELPNGVPNNLVPYILQVAAKKLDKLFVYGGDYETIDGTGVRDFVHVDDLAVGHVCAINSMKAGGELITLNLGTGRGYSVLEIINTFERVTGQKIPFEIVSRRSGDVAACYANANLAAKRLGWTAKHGIERMCLDSWRWQCMNLHVN